MKSGKYLIYSESSHKNQWEYFNNEKDKWVSIFESSDKYHNQTKMDIKYFAYTTKKDFCNIVGKLFVNSVNWVRERISEHGNKELIEITDKYKDCLIVVGRFYDLNEKSIVERVIYTKKLSELLKEL